MALTLAPVVSASVARPAPPAQVQQAGAQGGCAYPQPAGSLQVWENIASDSSDGNDYWWVWCGQSIPNGGLVISDLSFADHTLSGYCNRPFPFKPRPGYVDDDDWNDCISSVTVFLPSSLWVICVYQDAGFNGQAWHTNGPKMGARYTLPIGIKDENSSIRMDNDGSC
jgi:hypothetical protein